MIDMINRIENKDDFRHFYQNSILSKVCFLCLFVAMLRFSVPFCGLNQFVLCAFCSHLYAFFVVMFFCLKILQILLILSNT